MLSSTVSVVQFKTQRHQGHRFFILLLFALVFLQGSKLSADDDIAIKIRLQPRWDFGPLVQTTDRTAYDSIQDASLRRVRLEIVGRPRDRLHYIVAFAAVDDVITTSRIIRQFNIRLRVRPAKRCQITRIVELVIG